MNESIARTMCACDACGAELGNYYPEQQKNISINFPTRKTNSDGTQSYSSQSATFCNKACLASYLGGDKSSAIASLQTAEAKLLTLCDFCKRPIDTKDKDDKEDSIAATLKGPDGANKQYHFHGEDCLGGFLNGRVKKKAYKSKASITDGAYYSNGAICLDISEAAYISTKERNNLGEEHFLDPKRKSFPIRPGHECTDLNAALHRIGTYTGSMSHEELHSKILSRMKTHGCPLPKADK